MDQPGQGCETMNEAPCARNKRVPFVNETLIMAGLEKSRFGTPLEGLERLARRAAAQDSLATLVREMLPNPLGAHVVGASRREADLVIIVDSAAWAAQVRYAGPRLKEELTVRGEPVAGRIRVKVRGKVATSPRGR